MATPTSNLNYDPNARFDNGPAAAGCGKASNETAMTGPAAIPTGLTPAGVLNGTTLRVGFNAPGVSKAITGPNAIGQPTAVNRTYTLPTTDSKKASAMPGPQ